MSKKTLLFEKNSVTIPNKCIEFIRKFSKSTNKSKKMVKYYDL